MNNYTTDKLYIYPQYSATNTLNWLYLVYVDSDTIDFQQLANAEVGQILLITFIGRVLQKMPTNVSNAVIYNMIDESGDQYIDESGNLYIIIN